MRGRVDTKCRTRYHEPDMAHPPPSATPSDNKKWERETWVARMASLSNFRHHVLGDVPTPDDQQPAPSTYMTLMYHMHYTISTTHYHAPTGHWLVHGTDSLFPADYAPPPHNPGRNTYTRDDEPDDPHLWTRCSPSAAATRALVGRCIAWPSGPNRPWGSPQTGGCGRSRCAPSRGRPPEPQGTQPPAPHHPTALPIHGGSRPHGPAVAGPRHPHPKLPPPHGGEHAWHPAMLLQPPRLPPANAPTRPGAEVETPWITQVPAQPRQRHHTATCTYTGTGTHRSSGKARAHAQCRNPHPRCHYSQEPASDARPRCPGPPAVPHSPLLRLRHHNLHHHNHLIHHHHHVLVQH